MRRSSRRSKRGAGFGENGFEPWGGYMEAKKTKLLDQFTKAAGTEEAEDGAKIFSGVAIFVNGYTNPSSGELKRIMMIHGGKFHHYFRSEKSRGPHTTHIIATNLANAKVKAMSGHSKVVRPDWITDSVSAGKLLDFREYLLLSNESSSQTRINFPISSVNEVFYEETKETHEDSEKEAVQNDPMAVTSSNQDKKMNEYEEVPSSEDENTTSDHPEDNVDIINLEEAKGEAPINADVIQTVLKNKSTTIQRMGKAGDPNYLSDYYKHSRLHHISTMGSTFKEYITQLRRKHQGEFSGRDRLREWKKHHHNETDVIQSLTEGEKVFMHIDMDCFFVSVGLRKRPHLLGLPVAVTHAKADAQPVKRTGSDTATEVRLHQERQIRKIGGVHESSWSKAMEEGSSMSEIASCSYEARQAGIKNGMMLGRALKLCPGLQTIPYDFEAYTEVSYALYDTVAELTLEVQAVSCDEMFADVSQVLHETNTSPLQLATFLRAEIREKTGCPASTGFGANILQARLATRRAKPDGQFHLLPSEVSTFLRDVEVSELPGVGYKVSHQLSTLNIKTCTDLQGHSEGRLQTLFGPTMGHKLYEYSRGIDKRDLRTEQIRQSVSAEVNYGMRFNEICEAEGFLKELAAEVQTRLEEINCRGRQITLKIMVKAKDAPQESAKFMGHGVCDSFSRSCLLASATNNAAVLSKNAMALLLQLNIPASNLRGMGLQVSKLSSKSNMEGGLDKFLVRKEKEISTNTAIIIKKTENTPISSINENMELNTKPLSTFFSISDIDPEVLASLPEDIQAEILQHCNNNTNPSSSASSSVSGGVVFSEQPSTSLNKSLLSFNQPSTSQGQPSFSFNQLSTSSLNSSMMDISLSQVDPSFLAALPRELQEEIKLDLTSKRTNTILLDDPPEKRTRLSPIKVVSPKKVKGSPRSKSKALLKGQQKLIKSSMQKLSPTEISHRPVTPHLARPITPNTLTATHTDVEQPEGRLDEKMGMQEALHLVRTWVDTEERPQDYDTRLMIDFLRRVVVSRGLDIVHALLRTLCRKIGKKNIECWKHTFHQILGVVQEEVVTRYGAPLKVDLTFMI